MSEINDGGPMHHLQVDDRGDLWIHLDAGPSAPKASINLTAQSEMSHRNGRGDSIIARGIKAVADAMLKARGGA